MIAFTILLLQVLACINCHPIYFEVVVQHQNEPVDNMIEGTSQIVHSTMEPWSINEQSKNAQY
jgi:hypothetical protein